MAEKVYTDNWHIKRTRLEKEKQLVKGYRLLLIAWISLHESQDFTICCNDNDIDHDKEFCCLHSTAFNLVEGCLEYGNYELIEQPLSAMLLLPDCNQVWKDLHACWQDYRQNSKERVNVHITAMIVQCERFIAS